MTIQVAPSYYDSLLTGLPAWPHSPLGSKPLNLEARRKESRRLTALMANHRPFCYLRMGDMDLAYLLAIQDKRVADLAYDDGPIVGTVAYCNPGLGPDHASRYWQAFLHADYVDSYERIFPVEHWLPRLKLSRASQLHGNPDRETSVILLTWLEFEFKPYCQGRRVGVAGAEARLLELLTGQASWREAARPYWPENGQVFFHQVREDGRNLDRNLDLVKQDLRDFIQRNRIDTVFLSLGGGAKILCYELSRELNICAFDFGAMLRGLTYSGSDGNRASRSPHSPFLFRVPFDVFISALEEAFPNITPEELLAKAHAQLLLEVQHKEIGWTHAWSELDLSPSNRRAFQEAYREYRRKYRHLFRKSSGTRRERAGFLHFCGMHRLTWEGRRFMAMFRMKSALATGLRFVGR
jgi:hypothetical protein